MELFPHLLLFPKKLSEKGQKYTQRSRKVITVKQINTNERTHYGAPNQSIFPLYFCDPVYFLYGQFDFLYGHLLLFIWST